jgi:hypothetical protein
MSSFADGNNHKTRLNIALYVSIETLDAFGCIVIGLTVPSPSLFVLKQAVRLLVHAD